ncbi:ABC transporter permease [Candidatus Peregrinibacteria bacterium]|nr:ABC transporter permease [Candidatus Peregrinibacteria bacterium]
MTVSQSSFRQNLHTVLAFGWSDFVLKYRGSFFGYLWSLAAPLVRFLVIYYVFHPFVGREIAQYPLYLFLGIILWEHFTLTTTACMTMLHEKSSLIKKVPFPRILLVFVTGWTHLLIFLTHFAIFLAAAWAFGVPILPRLWYLPILLLQMSLLALGVGMILAAYCLKYRDIQHLWLIVSQLLFWLTPIMYPYRLEGPLWAVLLQTLKGSFTPTLVGFFDVFVRFQPLSILIHDARRVFLYAGTLGIPSFTHMIAFTALCAIFFGLSALVFVRRSRFFLQEY